MLMIVTALVSYAFVDIIGYQVVALVLLLVVSVLAMLFDIYPVLLTSFLSALIWNYFFIPPIFTFHIGTPQDVLMFLMYFVIALINAVLTFKIREFEGKSRDKEEKEKTINLYNTLLNSLSHELRTPISAIISAVDIIEDNDNNLTDQNRRDLVSEIKIAGLRLNQQVENLLSMSRFQAGLLKPRLDWCDINEMIFTVIKKYEDEDSHKIIFEADEHLPLLKLDGMFVAQILQNLITNALHHTPAKTKVSIEANFIHDNLVLMVTDNGPGFPPEEINFVFDRFYKLRRSTAGGTGLGLSIVKGFTEALNGKIKLENLLGGGAKFNIEIPAESSHINESDNE
ncbi:MAG: PAS domain-containing sensor histidine kinase [Saprospiraceae bacterium]|nr:PAS domain-containing sensor histidine kinase [Saprospiraceae bacterium]